jgi:outer membrane cobalamin receptor
MTNKENLRIGRPAGYGIAIVAACAIQAFGLVPALAQDTADEEEADETIYVYGRSLETTLPQELADYGSELVSLGRDDVEEKVYVDPQQMVQMEVPGLYMTSAGPFSYSFVSIQGSRLARYGPSDVLWLVDGVRLNNRLYPSTNPDTLPGNMVERVEVLKGGESLYYGTNAAGGVLNIVSRDFSDTFGGDVSMGSDTNDSYNVSGMLRGPAGPGNFVFFVSQDESDGYELYDHSEPSATDKDQSYEVTNIGVKYGLDMAEDWRLVTQIQRTEAQIDFLMPTLTNKSYNERYEDIASLRLDYAPTEGAQFFVKAYFHEWDSWVTQIDNVIGGAPGEVDVIGDYVPWGFDDQGINAVGKFRPDNGPEFLIGYDYQEYSAMDDWWRIAPIDEKVQAVYGQLRTRADQLENGAVSFGVRYNDMDENSATVWNLSSKYFLGNELYFQGGVSTNFTLPSAEQLYLNEPCCETGNPNLKPEESTNFNVGIGKDMGRSHWMATLFWRDIENIIDFDYDQPAFPNGTFSNLGKASIEGFEILGGFALTDRLTLEASYINNEVQLEDQERQMDYNPRWHAKASLGYAQGRFGGSFDARWVASVTSSQGSFGRVEHGDYNVADLSAFVYLGQEQNSQLALRLENAFDESYPALRGFRPADYDDGSGSFLAMLQGAPRTLRLSFRQSF